MATAGRKVLRAHGHKLSLEWSGETSRYETSSTGTCVCGQWEESASNQQEVRFEYRNHLERLLHVRWDNVTGTYVDDTR
jgi:hypothetical protein